MKIQFRVRRNLFFIFALFSIFIQSFPENKPVTTIESLPTRERAEMNIEVTKITSEKMKGKINSDEKTISLDFTEIGERVAKSRMRIREEDYEIFFVEDIKSFSSYLTNGMDIKNNNGKAIGRYNYKIDEKNGKKKIKIEYIETPEALYMVVKDKKTGRIIKIFNISEFEVEGYKIDSGNIAEGVTYSYNNAPCVFIDWGDNQILGEKLCTRDIHVVQEEVKGNDSGGLPTIAVGDGWNITPSWEQNNGHLSKKVEVLNHNFLYSELNLPASIYLSNPDRMNTGNAFYKRWITENPETARVYGANVTHNNKNMTQINAKFNMKINMNMDNLRVLRKVGGNELNNVIMTSGTASNQVTLIRGDVTNNSISFGISNSKSINYPDIILNKITMENNITLNFKDEYEPKSSITFNQNGTMEYNTAQQLEVVKSGEYANDFFMTGLSSKGKIEVRANSFEGNLLKEYNVGDTGIATAQEFTIPANNVNNSNATISLGYGENGVVTLNLKDWDKDYNSEYTFYIIHKEESGLIRRRNTVTIRTLGQSGEPPSPPEFEISADPLDFGTIIKGFTGDTAEVTIQILGANASNVNLSLSSSEVELSNGNSKIEASISLLGPQTRENGKYYTLTGIITKIPNETESGEHTGTIQLNVYIGSTTKVNKR